jgi:signal transduction histidine kinase
MNPHQPELVLVHAPFGRDADLIRQVLERSKIESEICATVGDLCSGISNEAGAALISDEALTTSTIPVLEAVINAQPAWSDLPLIVTTSGGEATAGSQRKLSLIEPLGNISLLERPLRTATLISAVRTALRARRRQYQLRDNFAERERLVAELERSNDELEQFAHVVSHDLQAPIRMITAFSDLLARRYRDGLDDNGRHIIGDIQTGARRMNELVKSLLHFATVGQNFVPNTEVDLSSVVTEVITTLQPAINELSAEVFVGPLPVVCADRVQLQQVLQNLVNNALKYAQTEARLKIEICAAQIEGGWQISISDNGPGIAPQFHERIFQPLKRLHGTEIAGTGMGLAVCRKIVERHGGRIWVTTAEGCGATFSFTLPVSNVGVTREESTENQLARSASE